MDITTFNFEEVGAFSSPRTDAILLAEAKERGFYEGHTPYNKLFSDLFFNGGHITLKNNLNENFKEKAYPYLVVLMHSFEPSHQEKEAVCAMLLSELIELK